MRGELEELSKSLGLRYVPKEELEDGLTRLRKDMEKEGMEASPVVQKMDCCYPSGTTQDGLLFVPLEEICCLWSGGKWSGPGWNGPWW